MKVILVYSELDTQYALLKHQEAVVFNDKKAAIVFMGQMYDSLNQDLNYLTHGSFGDDNAELNSPRTHERFYWVIIPAL